MIQMLTRSWLLVAWCCLVQCLWGQGESAKGIRFFEGSFAEALKLAEKENKIIFMDAYAVWCGPCKRMAATVFPDPAVGDFYNANFVNIKVDMEKGEGPQLAQKFGVRSYPTLLFIDHTGNVVHKDAGARPAEAFIELGKQALKKIDRSGEFEKKYNDGDRSAATVLQYIKAMNQAGKSPLRIANEYLSAQQDLKTPDNLEIIFEACVEADSRIFDLLVQHKAEIIKWKGEGAFNDRIMAACHRSFKKATEYRNEALLLEAQAKAKNVPSKAAAFKLTTDMDYYGQTGDAKKFLTAAKTYTKSVAKNDPVKLKVASSSCLKYFSQNKSVMVFAEKTALSVFKLNDLQENAIHLASIYKINGKKNEAVELLKKAIQNAKAKSEPTQALDYFLRDLEGA